MSNHLRIMIDRELTETDRRVADAFDSPQRRYYDRLAIAQKIAEDARRRNTPICQCDGCKMDRALPAVLRIIEHAKRREA